MGARRGRGDRPAGAPLIRDLRALVPGGVRSLATQFTGYAYLLPALGLIVVFVYIPVFYSFYLSLLRWNLMSPRSAFVGAANYERLMVTPEFWNALANSVFYLVGTVPTSMVVGLALALLVHRTGALRAFWRSVYFLPAASTFIAMAIVWQWIFHPSIGLLNHGLAVLGLSPIPWLDDPRYSLWSLIIIGNWQAVGYNMVLFLAGLGTIPTEMLDAAATDGACAIQRVRYVTIPMLSPTTLFVLIVSSIRSFQMFDLAKVLTEGGPVRSTEVLVYVIWQQAFQFFDIGFASALACVLFMMLLAFTVLQMRLFASRVHYQ